MLEKVFELNTLLWGGMLNPVVVLDGTTRKQVGPSLRLRKLNVRPDILINYSNAQLPPFLAPFRERTFPLGVSRTLVEQPSSENCSNTSQAFLTPSGFPLMTAAGTHPKSVPTGLSLSQLIWWLLCADASQQEQKTHHADSHSESRCNLLVRGNKQRK
jgi:hypothetical protein